LDDQFVNPQSAPGCSFCLKDFWFEDAVTQLQVWLQSGAAGWQRLSLHLKVSLLPFFFRHRSLTYLVVSFSFPLGV
jgi:hypothetical protein